MAAACGRSTRSLGCTTIGGSMEASRRMRRLWLAVSCGVVALAAGQEGFAQICKPGSQRTGEGGGWVTAKAGLGKLPEQPIFWHLYTYPTRAEREPGKGPRGD